MLKMPATFSAVGVLSRQADDPRRWFALQGLQSEADAEIRKTKGRKATPLGLQQTVSAVQWANPGRGEQAMASQESQIRQGKAAVRLPSQQKDDYRLAATQLSKK